MPLLTERKESHVHSFPATDQTTERILFALTAGERAQLYPAFEAESLSPARSRWTELDTLRSAKEWKLFLEEYRPTILVSCWCTPMVPVELLHSGALPLRYICHTTGSVKGVVPREFIQSGGLVSNWGNLISHAVAEHALLLMMASLRNLPAWYPSTDQPLKELWGRHDLLQTRSLRGRRVGIHGFGHIARELIHLLKPFDVVCSAYSENVPEAYMKEHQVTPCSNLEELFAQNEIVVECEALTKKNRGSVSEAIFNLMPPRGIFVNVARGGLVDEEAMGRFADKGRIFVAADVFQHEPLAESSPLRHNPNAILSPHIAGPTADWYPKCGEFALKNLRRYLSRGTVDGVVTLEIFDRST